MAEHSATNGVDGTEPRERPSWYVPIKPIPEGDNRTTAEVLRDTLGDEPLEMSPEHQAETKAFLDQFLVPRDS